MKFTIEIPDDFVADDNVAANVLQTTVANLVSDAIRGEISAFAGDPFIKVPANRLYAADDRVYDETKVYPV